MSKQFGKFTEQWLKDYEQNQDKDNKHRHVKADKQLQEQQGDVRHEQKVKEDDAGGDIGVKRAIFCNLRHNDNRRRDDDGSMSSVLDCLVSAGVLVDDNNKYIKRQAVGSSKEKQCGCDIVIIEIS